MIGKLEVAVVMVSVVVCIHKVAVVAGILHMVEEMVEVEGALYTVEVEEVVLYKVVEGKVEGVNELGVVGSVLPVAVEVSNKCMRVVEVVNEVAEEVNVVGEEGNEELEVAVNYSSKGRAEEANIEVEEVVVNLAVEAAVSAHNMVE